jgi:N-acetylneuraminic acid mutarotase
MMHANKQQNHARRRSGLVLALVGLLSVTGLVKGPTTLASAQTEARSWSYTGSLNTARRGHTATLLQNGKVLVAGGSDRANRVKTAELYDPETGAWSVTGKPRGGVGTATLLRDGKVLAVGGSGSDDVRNSAELYDPQTGTWSLPGSLHTRRYFHTATLLENGKVLVAGGFASASGPEYGDTFNTAELYDPETGAWSFTGNLNAPLGAHTATLLPNGQVLVAGGYVDDFLHSAELYDTQTGTWSLTGSLNTGIYLHTASLLPDGKVLVVGGITRIGNRIGTPVSSELYDPSTGTWSLTSNPNTPRSSHTATLLSDGNVLIVGGYANGYLGSAELGSNFAAVPPTILRPVISMASVAGKKLFITGENFDDGAVILLNGEEQKSKNDEQNPGTILIGKTAGKKIKPGDRVQVRNPDGTLSEEFIFTGS